MSPSAAAGMFMGDVVDDPQLTLRERQQRGCSWERGLTLARTRGEWTKLPEEILADVVDAVLVLQVFQCHLIAGGDDILVGVGEGLAEEGGDLCAKI